VLKISSVPFSIMKNDHCNLYTFAIYHQTKKVLFLVADFCTFFHCNLRRP
jgi:hypothetical protein